MKNALHVWLAAAALISAAAALAGDTNRTGTVPTTTADGHSLFLKNCAHCHASDAHGDEGPDLHHLDWTEEQIIKRIRTGKKGQMPAFAGKLKDPDIKALVSYLQSLK